MAVCREKAPEMGTFRTMEIPSLREKTLSSGIRLHYRQTVVNGLLRIDLMVRAGSAFQPRPLVAQLANLLLKEGCREVRDSEGHLLCEAMSPARTAEMFDGYGAYVYYSTMMEYVIVTLCTTAKYLKETLSLLRNLYAFPSYPEDGLRRNLELREQQWRVDREKVQVFASMKMNELLFGEDHPYGRMLNEYDFQNIDTFDLKSFHEHFYRPEQTCLVVTGDVGEEVPGVFEHVFGRELLQMTAAEKYSADAGENRSVALEPPHPSPERHCFVDRTGSLQAAIRFSLPCVGQQHPDFRGLQVLNALLGGYFGSRLMTALREEKGYTYGIASTHTVYRDYSYIDIETQTAVTYAHALIDGVWEELDRLASFPVPADELDRLRNYLYGEYARMVDGPFALSDLFVSSLISGQDMSECFSASLETVRTITPERLQELASTYFHQEDFFLVGVGLSQ